MKRFLCSNRFLIFALCVCIFLPKMIQSQDLMAQAAPTILDTQTTTFAQPSLTTQAIVLALLSLLPFIVMILTSFLKLVIVLSLLRNALGVQQAPPEPNYQWRRLHALYLHHVSYRCEDV